MSSNPNVPTFAFDDLTLDWQMTRCERFAFWSLLQHHKPSVSIEVGTWNGGSLQVLSRYSEKVYSLDIRPKSRDLLQDKFSNVEFLVGSSHELLGPLLQEISRKGEQLGFVLIDGDHSAAGVRTDINSLLKYRPVCPLLIVCHDSFNPECRRGMVSAEWQSSPYVHYVELDFVPGVFHEFAYDTAEPRSMWGGFAVVQMLPEPRAGELVIGEAQRGLFSAVKSRSRYSAAGRAAAIAQRLPQLCARFKGAVS
ncbi:MAG: class I SAM-dependent methyltransferase [Bdellovibrionales bacterium]|nr:class I SAM-dependent methyltransferase [Bdellovibrionales bacterium]